MQNHNESIGKTATHISSRRLLTMAGCAIAVTATPLHAATADQPPAPPAPSSPVTPPLPAAPAPAAVEPPAEDSSAARAAALDKLYQVKDFASPYYNFAQTVTQDDGHWRTAIAKAGFGLVASETLIFAGNLKESSLPHASQSFWGDKPSLFNRSTVFLTWDAGLIGLTGGQVQMSAVLNRSTFAPYQPNQFLANRLDYYQSLAGGKFSFTIGLLNNGQEFVGSELGGNAFSPFGPSASIFYQVGLTGTPSTAPTVMFKTNFKNGIYNRFAIQRSMPPEPSIFTANARENPSGLSFGVKGGKALYIDEIGYRKFAAPGQPYTWVRVGGIYNSSQFARIADPTRRRDNYAVYALVDRQVTQPDGSSKANAAHGLYLGASAMYSPASINTVTQYYEARAYYRGPFKVRPGDMVGLVLSKQTFSHDLKDRLDDSAPETGLYGGGGSLNVTPSYSAMLSHGLYVTLGLSYTDHPKTSYRLGETSSVLFLSSLFVSL